MITCLLCLLVVNTADVYALRRSIARMLGHSDRLLAFGFRKHSKHIVHETLSDLFFLSFNNHLLFNRTLQHAQQFLLVHH